MQEHAHDFPHQRCRQRALQPERLGLGTGSGPPALWRARNLAYQNHNDILHLPTSVDVAHAVLVWLIWDQSRGRSYRAHPGTHIQSSAWPTRVPDHASAYQHQLLEPLLTDEGEMGELVTVAVLLLTTADHTVINQGGDRDTDGQTTFALLASDVQVIDARSITVVACPVCEESDRLPMAWDGFAATASCPHGHGVWTEPEIGPREWKSLCTQGQVPDQPR